MPIACVGAVAPKMHSPILFFASVLSLLAHTADPYASLAALPVIVPFVNPLASGTHSASFLESTFPPRTRATTLLVIKNERPCSL